MSKYGEPWEVWTSFSWRRVMDADGLVAMAPCVLKDGNPDMYPVERIERAVACVNACAGIDDPEAALMEAKGAMDAAAAYLEIASPNARTVVARATAGYLRAAVAKLEGKP